jgi:hypothetical protein
MPLRFSLLALSLLVAACEQPVAPTLKAQPPAKVPPATRTTPVVPEPVLNPPPPSEEAETAAADAVATSELVPTAFRGEWNTDLARCGTDLGEMRLSLTGASIGLYESGGPVLDVILEDEQTALLRTRLSGEGETWERPFRLRLTDDGRTLTDISGEIPVVRHRCPGAP